MINIHKSKRNYMLIFVIVFILGVCLSSYQTDSRLCVSVRSDFSHFSAGQTRISANIVSCTQEMLQGRVYNLFEHFFSHGTYVRSFINGTDYDLNSGIFFSISQEYYAVYIVILFCPVLPGRNMIKYLRRSDGKKRH